MLSYSTQPLKKLPCGQATISQNGKHHHLPFPAQVHQQLVNLAPSGRISSRVFVEMLEDLTALTAGEEILPDLWMDLNAGQLEALAQQVAPAGSGESASGGSGGATVEWPSFLLAAAKPWPRPTQRELLKTLRRFREADAGNTGHVTLDQYKSVRLWWKGDPPTKKKPAPEEGEGGGGGGGLIGTGAGKNHDDHALPHAEEALDAFPEDPSAPYPYDRTAHVQRLFFEFFTDQKASPMLLDYENFLFFFCVDPDPFVGFTNALALSMNKTVPNVKDKIVELATGRKEGAGADDHHADGKTGGGGGAVESTTNVPKITGSDGQEILVSGTPNRGRDAANAAPAAEGAGEGGVTRIDSMEESAASLKNVTLTLDGLHRCLHHGEYSIAQTNDFNVENPEDIASRYGCMDV